MTVDASLLVKSGSGILLALAGAVILLRATRTRTNLALGTMVLSWGLFFLANNLFATGGGAPFRWSYLWVVDVAHTIVSTVALLVIVREGAREDGARGTAWALLPVAVWIAIGIVYVAMGGAVADRVYTDARAVGVPAPLAWAPAAFYDAIDPDTLIAIYASARVLVSDRADERYQLAVALTFGLFAVYTTLVFTPLPVAPRFATLNLVGAVVTLVALPGAWLAAGVRRRSRRALAAGNALLLAGLAGLLAPLVEPINAVTAGTEPGRGIVRIMGWTILAWAILRHEAFGLDFRARTLRRSTLAAIALAALFIVAQVAQVYFSATFGLATGAVVAGAFLFMASPLQRAAERALGEGSRGGGGGRGGRAGERALAGSLDADRGEDVYRDALRIALRDRVVTRAEELHLAELGERLGLPARRALELRHEVEAELAATGNAADIKP